MADLSCTFALPDGTLGETEAEVDPRFGTQSPIAARTSITIPGGGPVISGSNERLVIVADPANPFTLLQQIDVQTIESSTTTRTYTNDNGETIVTTGSPPLLRERTQWLDTLGREVKAQTGYLHPVRREYDERGRVSAIMEGPDPDTSETRAHRPH